MLDIARLYTNYFNIVPDGRKDDQTWASAREASPLKTVYKNVYPFSENELSYSNINEQKGRNIKDHIFVIYAAINGNSSAVDIQSIDITFTKWLDKL